MTQPDPFMPDDLIRTRNWAGLSAEEKEALKEVAATEEEFRLLKLMLNTATEPTEDIPEISPAVHERLKSAFHEQHERRGKVVTGWWRYAAAAAVVLAVAGTIWIMTAKNKKETEIAREEPKTVQPVVPKDTVKPSQSIPDTSFKQTIPPVMNPQPEQGPVKHPKLRKPAVRQTIDPPPPQIPVMDPQPSVAVNINTSLKENSELLQLVAAVY